MDGKDTRERYAHRDIPRAEYLGDELPVIRDWDAVGGLPHGRLIRDLARQWFFRRKSQMRTATFEPETEVEYTVREDRRFGIEHKRTGSLSRYGVEHWRDLEAELWIIVMRKGLQDSPGGYVRTVLESKIQDALSAGTNRYETLPEHEHAPDKNYGADGTDLNDDGSMAWENIPDEAGAFTNGYLNEHEPTRDAKRKLQKRWESDDAFCLRNFKELGVRYGHHPVITE